MTKVKVERTDFVHLEKLINLIGYKNILNILPEHSYEGTLFVIIYEQWEVEE